MIKQTVYYSLLINIILLTAFAPAMQEPSQAAQPLCPEVLDIMNNLFGPQGPCAAYKAELKRKLEKIRSDNARYTTLIDTMQLAECSLRNPAVIPKLDTLLSLSDVFNPPNKPTQTYREFFTDGFNIGLSVAKRRLLDTQARILPLEVQRLALVDNQLSRAETIDTLIKALEAYEANKCTLRVIEKMEQDKKQGKLSQSMFNQFIRAVCILPFPLPQSEEVNFDKIIDYNKTMITQLIDKIKRNDFAAGSGEQ